MVSVCKSLEVRKIKSLHQAEFTQKILTLHPIAAILFHFSMNQGLRAAVNQGQPFFKLWVAIFN